MYKSFFNKRVPQKFTQFTNKGYALFACVGREVIIGTLSVATLNHATAAETRTVEGVADSTMSLTREKGILLDDVEVTGSRAPLGAGRAARMVTVLDRRDIQSAPVQSVNDLLKYAVGVDVRQRGPIGAQTDISMRGGTNEQITILLNGINICDPQTGHNAFDLPVELSEIERIEVLEGPAGRVYGTSSLVGAINIVTRPADKTSGEVRIEGGSFGYLSSGARGNIKSSRWNNQLSGSYTRSDGFSRNKSGGLNADYNGGKVFYQGEYSDTGIRVGWHAGLSTKGYGSNTFYSAKFDDQYERITKTYTAIQAETTGRRFRFKPAVYWNRTYDRFELIRGSEASVPFNYHRTDVFGVNMNSYFDWTLGRTAFGAEFRNEDLISGNLGEPLASPKPIHGTDREYTLGLNRSNISFNLEHNILLKRFTLSAGLIAVKNTWNGMSFKVYPGVDASYRFGNNWKLYASYNTSLRMPSFTELYYSVGGHKADKYLKPEEMTAIEGGAEYISRGFRGKLSVYHHHGRNMIDWIMDTSVAEPEWQSVNHTRLNSLGMEMSALLDFSTLLPSQRVLRSLNVAYSYIDQDKDLEANLQSQYALEYLRHKLTASLDLHIIKSVDLGLKYRFQDRTGTYTDVAGNIQEYAPYGIFDARLSYNATHYYIYIEANNIFDKDYVDYGNVEQPGTWVTAGIKWKF